MNVPYLYKKDRRTPRGVRGLKYHLLTANKVEVCGRTPRGVRGLKYKNYIIFFTFISRTPRGVRGLKSLPRGDRLDDRQSHPSRGAWIEISPLYLLV